MNRVPIYVVRYLATVLAVPELGSLGAQPRAQDHDFVRVRRSFEKRLFVAHKTRYKVLFSLFVLLFSTKSIISCIIGKQHAGKMTRLSESTTASTVHKAVDQGSNGPTQLL